MATASSVPIPLQWSPSRKADPRQVGFLDLPRELRDEIYHHAYCISGAIFMYSADPTHIRPIVRAKVVREKESDPFPAEPQSISKLVPINLLRSCRQVYAESCGVLYGRNLFRFYSNSIDFAPQHYPLVRFVSFTTDSMPQKIFDHDLEIVGYWWKRHFWRDIIRKSTTLLERFPNLERLTFPIKSNRHGQSWTPAFMAAGQRTREYRVNHAAVWLKYRCEFENERLRQVLHLEIVPSGPPKEMYQGSKFLMEDWDCEEFAEAFERMKTL